MSTSLGWNFCSLKSGIKNFNETTSSVIPEILRESNSSLVTNTPSGSTWIYPYTYLNRHFDHILRSVVNRIEQEDLPDWQIYESELTSMSQYPYQSTTFQIAPKLVQERINMVLNRINRGFNSDPPIVGLRDKPIHYYSIGNSMIIIIRVYKKYTLPDIKYSIEVNPHINDHLADTFDRWLLLHFSLGNLRHLRLIAFNPSLLIESYRELAYLMPSLNYFYLAKSADPNYRILNNTEARNLYIDYLQRQAESAQYQCFNYQTSEFQTQQRTDDPTLCEMAGGIWEKKCRTNRDCPMYQLNRNFPNTLGGCDVTTGYCQWPMGVTPLTYRQPKNLSDAWCYNCSKGILGKNTVGHCCGQKLSPDYMYPNDTPIRYRNRNSLASKGLKWSRY